LTINANFANEEFGKLADEVFHCPRYAGKTLLICWHHGMIPQLAEKLNAVGMRWTPFFGQK
jgi:hypothetical protein